MPEMCSGGRADSNYEVGGRSRSDVLNSVKVVRRSERNGSRTEKMRGSVDCYLHGSNADQPHFVVCVSMGRVRSGIGREGGFMHFESFTGRRYTTQHRTKLG